MIVCCSEIYTAARKTAMRISLVMTSQRRGACRMASALVCILAAQGLLAAAGPGLAHAPPQWNSQPGMDQLPEDIMVAARVMQLETRWRRLVLLQEEFAGYKETRWRRQMLL